METSTAVAAALTEGLRGAGAGGDVVPGVPAGYRVAGPAPVCAVRPRDEAGVAAVLGTAATEGWTVVVRGAGTLDRTGAPVARGPAIVLDARGLSGVVSHAPGDLTIRVRPGEDLRALNRALRAHGQHLALRPPGGTIATVGGAVGGDAWGPERLAWGAPRDIVLGLRVVDGRGQAFTTGGHVVKNVSGLDIGKLFVGSFGTLGVLTEVSLRLRPLAPARALWAARTSDAAAAWKAVRAMLDPEFQLVGLAVDWRGESPVVSVAMEGVDRELQAQLPRLGNLVGSGDMLPAAATEEAWAAAHEPAPFEAWALLRCEVPDGALEELYGQVVARPESRRCLAWPGLGTLWCALAAGSEDALRALRGAAEAAGGRAILVQAPDPLPVDFPPFGDTGALAPLLAGIKRRFDPSGILAPGRMLPV
jgi:glycolate oxidase FAD binding subunit